MRKKRKDRINRGHVPGEIKQIPAYMLKTGCEYQLPLDRKRIKAIVDNFDPYLVVPIKVSYRDGRYFILDGKHLFQALKEINKGKKDFLVTCRVYSNITKEEECYLYAAMLGIHS